MRVALAILRRNVADGTLFLGKFIAEANSLRSLGCGVHNGPTTRPYSSSPCSMIMLLDQLQQYSEDRQAARRDMVWHQPLPAGDTHSSGSTFWRTSGGRTRAILPWTRPSMSTPRLGCLPGLSNRWRLSIALLPCLRPPRPAWPLINECTYSGSEELNEWLELQTAIAG